ncbi:transmembrane protein 87A-like [Gigantopelta aegis]|uniref:transmembrane protein 87A-like n=1 Tax=Gigantopelta aegis TaxID=1735272 RepID=UPI001B88BA62|nr:transmembrane protein 87A-like [Gigantopelta aegis]
MAISVYKIFLILLVSNYIRCMPEEGVWTVNYNSETKVHAFPKCMNSNTKISVTMDCGSDNDDVDLKIRYLLRESPCAQEFDGIENNAEIMNSYLQHPETVLNTHFDYSKFSYILNTTTEKCAQHSSHINLEFGPQSPQMVIVKQAAPEKTGNQSTTVGQPVARAKRAATEGTSSMPTTVTVSQKMTTTTTKKPDTESIVATTWKDGCYVFILEIDPSFTSDKVKKNNKMEVTVKMSGDHGYISAVDFPLEVFYGVMGLVYIGFGIVWILVLACHWKDLLRVQFWVGGVIVLGMLEKAVFFAEYKNIAETGKSVRGAFILAELVSAMKRTLARMLVIVVSLGFGIVKPRLGQTFHKVLCVGVAFFVLASLEGCMRGSKSKSDQSNALMLATVPLAVTDAVIVWWIFTSLVQTTRTLRLRRNIVKLSLYRHFTNTLIFAVLASIAFMIWSIIQHKLKYCTTDWKELWVDEAFWHLLFSVILLIIMILWRPDANNQRYAFSPLLDAAEDEIDEDQLMNDAFDGMKLRGVKGQANGSPRQKEKSKPDDDLKWVEENIPSSVADKALPSLLDSDEELMNTKFEMSKME